MAKTKEQKTQILQDLKEAIDSQKSMYFIDYKGMTSNDVSTFRKELRKNDAKLYVAKKTLATIAFKEKKIDFDLKPLQGQLGIIFSLKDAFLPTKEIYNVAKTEKIKILGGCYIEDGKLNKLTGQDVIAYASIPSRDELYAKLAYVLNDTAASFARVINAIKEKQSTSAA
ncbi:MAG TPA: 50S ribosomal protein L10 [Candidatus Pacearchaeota archaeon]|nr:50S ribosomal protein L10 [Candidatus Pacearchaeota archaeon]